MSPEYTIPNILKYKQHTVKAKFIFFLMLALLNTEGDSKIKLKFPLKDLKI